MPASKQPSSKQQSHKYQMTFTDDYHYKITRLCEQLYLRPNQFLKQIIKEHIDSMYGTLTKDNHIHRELARLQADLSEKERQEQERARLEASI